MKQLLMTTFLLRILVVPVFGQLTMKVTYEQKLLMNEALESALSLEQISKMSKGFGDNIFRYKLEIGEGVSKYTFSEKRTTGAHAPLRLTTMDFFQTDTIVIKAPSRSKENKYKRLAPYRLSDWSIQKENTEIKSILGYRVICAQLKQDPTIKAWFSPQIPVKTGPDRFGGLPGLILKVEGNHKSWEAVAIEQLKTSEHQIAFPSGYTILEEEAWDKWLNKNRSEFLN
jgi:GLPGLI family protein